MNAINSKIRSASANQLIYYDIENKNMDTTITVNIRLISRINKAEQQMLQKWLIKRFKNEKMKLIIE